MQRTCYLTAAERRTRSPFMSLPKLAMASLIVFVLAGLATAAQPRLSGSIPRGIQRGTTQKVIFTGTRIKDGRQLLFDIPGINVLSVTPVDNSKVEAELEVPADTPPGLYPVRLVTESDISDMIMFAVGSMPNVDEVEPNSDIETPQLIETNVTIEGKIATEDVDYFAVDLKKGERLTAEVEGTRLRRGRGDPFFDPYIAILNSERFELAFSDDAPLLQQDSVCSITAPEDGRYIVMVRDSSFGGRNDAYRLHIGSFPRPIAVVPAGGAPGELLNATFISIDGQQWTESIQLPSEPMESFPVVVSNEHGTSPSPNYIRVQPQGNVIEQEPNNSTKESTAGTLPAAFCGILAEPGDIDFFSFEAKKDQTVGLRLFSRNVLRSELDGVINLYNEKGGRVGGNDDSGGPDSFLEYKIPADGVYHVRISDHLEGGGPGYAYHLEAVTAGPELTLSLPDRSRYEATMIPVPQGNRHAVMLNATRKAFGGAIDIEALNLPEGVTATPIQMPANRTTVPLLLTATAEAPLDGRLVNLVGKVEKRDDIVSRFDQQHQLVGGLNNAVPFEYRSNRAAIAVTQKSPCTIAIVQPQVPVVRDGSMELTVTIDRGDYDADVAIRLLYNPPGIGSSGSIKIAKGTNEAKIPITANGSAAIGEWPVIACATLSDGNGSYEIASEPITLNIEDKIFTFGFPKTSTELGADASVIVDLEIGRPFEGACEVELVGIPAGVTCEAPKQTITNETEQIVFAVKVDEKARVGQHKTLVARAKITSDKGVITQTQGTGILQVDKPLPAPVAKPAPKPEAAAAPKPAAPKPAAAKPLSRLEQLRLMREEARAGN
ncbi:putative subtilase-type serine protease precursor [Rosistilla carotiformis]|uniref:Putative subtilase-type serine protease n=1 Tax=Rosistilla carotiformis TaxID=2528017 RepID=A0A518JWK1_9BACT|nr:PPC domain-containing protein [Rosistilla carotiformis]QDV69920.1 putative subtilase-type serine protease precursor [Rosistilla carotiformis]